MFRKQNKQIRFMLTAVFLVIFLLAGCAVKKAVKADPKTGVFLNYRMAKDQALKYRFTSLNTQKVTVMGREIETKSTTTIDFSARSKGFKEKNLLLGITFDNMTLDVKSAQGDMNPDLSSLKGKTFDLILSPMGQELELTGTEKLKYNLGAAGERSAVSSFRLMFPDLAGRQVKIGDSWESKDDVTENEGNFNTRLMFGGINTLQGAETVNGYECVKVTAEITGGIDSKGRQMGNDVTIKGKAKGSSTFYFAYEKGMLVKDTTEIVIEAEAVTQGMTIPLTSVMKIETVLVK